jgi:serine/threonine protein kinase
VDTTKKHRRRAPRPRSFFEEETRVLGLDHIDAMLAEGSTPGPPEIYEPPEANLSRGPLVGEIEEPTFSDLETDPRRNAGGSNPPSFLITSAPRPEPASVEPDDDDEETRIHLECTPEPFFPVKTEPPVRRAAQPSHRLPPALFRHSGATDVQPLEAASLELRENTELRPIESPEGPYCPAGTPELAAYQIVRKLAVGGMGIVYEAFHRESRQRVAVKYMRKSASEQPELVKRFLGEAVAASRINHPGVTTIFDYGHDRTGVPYLVMEYLDGQSLAERLAVETLGAGEFLEISRQIATILEAAHAHGIVHRDLKPDNIFVVGEGERVTVKILDFGVAKFQHDDLYLLRTTKAGQVLGTPYYMSPEQCGGGEVDHRSDIYALGCVMYQMLTGRVPFSGNLLTVVYGHRQDQATPITAYNPSTPPGLVALVEAMMAKSPADRPQRMADVANALTAVSAGAPVPVPPPRDPSADIKLESQQRRPRHKLRDTLDSMPGQQGGSVVAHIPVRLAPAYAGGRDQAPSWILWPVLLVLVAAILASLLLAGVIPV